MTFPEKQITGWSVQFKSLLISETVVSRSFLLHLWHSNDVTVQKIENMFAGFCHFSTKVFHLKTFTCLDLAKKHTWNQAPFQHKHLYSYLTLHLKIGVYSLARHWFFQKSNRCSINKTKTRSPACSSHRSLSQSEPALGVSCLWTPCLHIDVVHNSPVGSQGRNPGEKQWRQDQTKTNSLVWLRLTCCDQT